MPKPRKFSPGAFTLLATLLSAAGLLAFRIPHLGDAVSPDEALYLLLARLLQQGGLPYRDILEIHSPGLFFYLAAAPTAMLQHDAWLRLLSIPPLAGAAGLGALLLDRLEIRRFAILAGVMLFTLLNCLDRFEAAYFETEQVMTLPLMAMLYGLVRRKPPAWAWFFWGLATLFKQTGVVFLPMLLLLDFGDAQRRSEVTLKGLLARAVAASAGWLAALLFFALKGGLKPMVQSVLFDALHQGGEYAAAGGWLRQSQFRLLYPLLILLLITALLRWSSLRSLQSPLALGGMWLACGLLFLKAQKMGYPHYGAILTPAFLLLVAGGIDGCAQARADARPRRIAFWLWGGLFILMILALLWPLRLLKNNRYPDVGWENHSIAVRDVARALQERHPDRWVVAIDNHPGWYWHLKQTPPRQVWLGQRLDYFPKQLPEIEATLDRYTEGKNTLYIFYRDFWGEPSAPQEAFRRRLIERGAKPFPLAAALAPVIVRPDLTAYSLDRRVAKN